MPCLIDYRRSLALLALTAALSAAHAQAAATSAAFDPTDPNNGGYNRNNDPVVSDFRPGTASPGGDDFTTKSFTQHTAYLDTPSTATVDDYRVVIEGILNGTSVFNQTLSVPYGSAAAATAVSQARTALITAGATSTSNPVLTFNSTTFSGSKVSYTQTGSTTADAPPTGTTTLGPSALYNLEVTGAGKTYFEPTFHILAGDVDFNFNTASTTTITRDEVTTNTYLTEQTYVITGTASGSSGGGTTPPAAVPLPVAAWQGAIGLGLVGIGLSKRAKASRQS